MKKLHSIAIYALMAPAMTLGAGSALAQTVPTNSDRAQAQEQRTTQEQQQHTMPEQAQKHVKAHGTYLSSKPANAFRADELIGSDLTSRPDNENIGAISDLLIDENGQVVAVIVEVGGFLGLGEKEVAISWDSVERTMNEQGDGHKLTVTATKDALTNAPEYKKMASKY